jgi:hypothetical protein
MYPLQDDYIPKISEFLDTLNGDSGDIEIRSSNMSTRVFGEFNAVNDLLAKSMRSSMEQYGKIVFVCKYLQGDARELRGYE